VDVVGARRQAGTPPSCTAVAAREARRVSVSAVIKFAPVLTVERYQNPEWARPGRDLYRSGSLQLLPDGSATIYATRAEYLSDVGVR